METPRPTQEPIGPGAVLALAGTLVLFSSWPSDDATGLTGPIGIAVGFLLAIVGYGLLLAGATAYGASHLPSPRHRVHETAPSALA